MIQPIFHYGIHFIGPFIIARIFYYKTWKSVYIIMFLGFLIDLDHLLANPIFNPNRCSINFHILHSYYAIAVYFILAFFKSTRLIGFGLLVHILADIVDCYFISL